MIEKMLRDLKRWIQIGMLSFMTFLWMDLQNDAADLNISVRSTCFFEKQLPDQTKSKHTTKPDFGQTAIKYPEFIMYLPRKGDPLQGRGRGSGGKGSGW